MTAAAEAELRRVLQVICTAADRDANALLLSPETERLLLRLAPLERERVTEHIIDTLREATRD